MRRAARANGAVSEITADAAQSRFLGRTSSILSSCRRLPEAITAGTAYGALLCWLSTCLVASFRGAYLARPYWNVIPALRTDTCGAIAFVVAGVSLMASEYLRLARHHNAVVRPHQAPNRGPAQLVAQAASETIAILSTGLVAYISVNAVTHPVTLGIHATHFASWPSEGALRVIALFACVASVAVLRYMQAGAPNGAQSQLFSSEGVGPDA